MMEQPERTIVTKLLELAQVDVRYLQELERLRQQVVVMFTDIQGSTAYFEEHGDAAGLLMVRNCNRTIRQVVEKHQGRVIKNIGDGMMSTFTESAAAVEAAIEFQTLLAEVNELRSEAERIGLRVGIHQGAGIVKSNDVFGDVVNMASRVESEAAPGQIVISDALYKQLPENRFDIREMGRFKLKGKIDEHSLYQVVWIPSKAQPAPPSEVEISKRSPRFRIQLVKQDGTLGPQNPVMPQLTIGRTRGDLRFATDANMAPLNARVFVQDSQLFVEDLSEGREKVFVRLTGGHTLQMSDIIIMGQQVFCFREKAGVMSAVTLLGASLKDLRNVLDDPVAELVCVDANGRASGEFPISWVETQFGRTHGHYTFPGDKMMSRIHARILQRGEDFLLEDAGSRNGTFISVRGKTPLVDGSTVLVGSQLFRVQS
jgi:class 3 adenylate cyclase